MLKEFIVSSPLFGITSALRDWIDINRSFFFYPPAGPGQMEARCGTILIASIGEGTFVDVGAHIGSVIAAVRRRRPMAQLVAVEADPHKASSLNRRFPNVIVHAVAIGDKVGEAKFFIDPQRPGYSSTTDRESNRSSITVPLTTLDDLLLGIDDVDVIKIDIEGAEPEAIAGAVNILQTIQPLVYFESAINPGDRPEQIYHRLSQLRYEIYLPSRLAHDAPPMSEHGFLEAHLPPRRTINFFAVHAERRNEFRDRARHILGLSLS